MSKGKRIQPYNVPGLCAKCGAVKTNLRWEESVRNIDGESIGSLFAVCNRCGYEWRVRARDEG